MKKILVTTLVAAALVTSALAQGSVTMGASATKNPISYTLDGTTIVKVPVSSPGIATIPGYGNLNVGLYSAPVGTPLSFVAGVPDLSAASPWRLQTSPLLQTITGTPGTMLSTAVTLGSGTAGSDVQLVVVGWTGTAADFATAASQGALLGWAGSTLSTGGMGWQNPTGTALLPAVVSRTATTFNGLVLAPIPEPSTFALAGLGAAALLIFRRRK